jgi:hypothetical protein
MLEYEVKWIMSTVMLPPWEVGEYDSDYVTLFSSCSESFDFGSG